MYKICLPYTSGLSQCENEAFARLKVAENHPIFSEAESVELLKLDTKNADKFKLLASAHDIFARPAAPMKFIGVILEAVNAGLTSPIKFEANEWIVSLLTIAMKIAYYNKQSMQSVSVENTHQGVFSNTVLMHSYQEILTLICKQNKSNATVQIQIELVSYPLEGIHLGKLRLVNTNNNALLKAEEDSMFRSLKYVIGKRSNPSPARVRLFLMSFSSNPVQSMLNVFIVMGFYLNM